MKLFIVNMALCYTNIIMSYLYLPVSASSKRQNPEQYLKIGRWIIAIFVGIYTITAMLIAFRWSSVVLSCMYAAYMILDSAHTAYCIVKSHSIKLQNK